MTKRTSVRQRRVSAELRALRIKANLTCREVSEGLGFSESKISRMETGDRGLYVDDVSAILGFLHAPTEKRQELLKLLRDGEERNWHEIHGKLPPTWKELIRFEDDALRIKNYEPLVIPGLAQTPDYARAVIHATNPSLTESDVEGLVAARLARQLVLSRRDAPEVHLLVEETAVRRIIGDSEVMRLQLESLLAINNRSCVTMQVVPFSAGGHPGLEGPLVILEFRDEPTLTHAETRSATSFIEDEEPVARARLGWRGILAAALSPEDSAGLISTVIDKMTAS
ncbi:MULTISPECIES: helix-turn-helix transcriptional regulator [unclassified Amycolatopsis]|uniref:helix-turn-helix domain-containing protein n=1 Tax=unclassified Amycolatopsis TaxID=2618356 RepID=UPI001C6A013D|nr:helix-turn-helix transcriptional regulator [Amycolatopsis sp. DSM 110486]QYN24602.1 helix-turn-helix domain-containing protein [Amycolatopsis sp. DSM 110486]